MYFEEFELGFKTQIEPAVINKEDMVSFANKYDPIPLHTDEEYAKSTIFGGLIAPGVMSFMSVWAKYLETDLAGDELLAGKSTKIEWFKPVFADDVLTSNSSPAKSFSRYFAHTDIKDITPGAIRPPNIVDFAYSSSVCKGSGSYFFAKSIISFLFITAGTICVFEPNSNSSKYIIIPRT